MDTGTLAEINEYGRRYKVKRYVFMLFIFMFIIVSCSTNKSVTQDHVLGQWQFNGSSDVEKYYKKYGNGMLSSMEIFGEIMKVGHLFLDGSFVEFKDNGIASFESNDVEYEIQQNENDAQIKFIDNGVESIHPVVFKKNKLQIAYFVLGCVFKP